jgi:putative transposase
MHQAPQLGVRALYGICTGHDISAINGRLRDECLDVNEFISTEHARAVMQIWQDDYNHRQLHGSLDNLTPSEYAIKSQQTDPEAPNL